MKIKSAKGENYWALICDCGVGKSRYMICGVMASSDEAKALAEECKGCVSRHTIRKCDVVIRWK